MYSYIKTESKHRLNVNKSEKAQLYEGCTFISIIDTLKWTEVATKTLILKN